MVGNQGIAVKIGFRGGLPYIDVTIVHGGKSLSLQNILLDTGSAGSVFLVDRLLSIGLQYEPNDVIHRIRGVGGAEFVFSKRVDHVQVGELEVSDFEIEVGAMNYGFQIEGILGMDFLTQVGAVIDLSNLEIRAAHG